MKKFMIVFACMVLVFTNLASATAATAKNSSSIQLTANKVVKKPVLDGKFSTTEWAAAQKIEHSTKQFGTPGRGLIANQNLKVHASANVYLLWSETGLYFAMDAKDNTPSYGAEDGLEANSSDCFQLVFDPMNKKEENRSHAYIFTFVPVTGEDNKGKASWWEHWQYIGKEDKAGVEVKGSIKKGGYIIEGYIPWKALQYNGEKFTVKEGAVLGFGMVQVDYADYKWVDFVTTFDSFDKESTYNTLVLKSKTTKK